MPNHCTNVIKMKNITNKPYFTEGEYNNGEKFKYLDFEKIIPMPEELKDATSPGFEDVALYYILNKLAYTDAYVPPGLRLAYQDMLKRLDELLRYKKDKLLYLTDGVNNDCVKAGLINLKNIVNHGYNSWYDWSCHFWGTKWNSYDFSIIDNDTVKFDTAWSSPDPIFMEISRLNPYDLLSVDYVTEGSFYVNYLEYLDGDLIEIQQTNLVGIGNRMSKEEYTPYINKYLEMSGYDKYKYNPEYEGRFEEMSKDFCIPCIEREIIPLMIEKKGE